MHLSVKGNLESYFMTAMRILFELNFDHLKLVGRGSACVAACKLSELITSRSPVNLTVNENTTQALNKRGQVVDELHVMFSK
jgi:hypothetical protein